MTSYIGIDLGTTFSAVAYIDETGSPKIIKNQNKKVSPEGNIMPSCVAIYEDKFIVGEQARKSLQIQDNTVARFKRDMGTSKMYNIKGKKVSPIDLSALVLTELKKYAQKEVGNISDVVVTVPANFSNKAREGTMTAAKKAGLNIKYIINEPTAAALYYAFNTKNTLSGYYGVFDLGGGTFDFTIIKANGKDIDIVATNGVQKLGGDDFDRALIKLVEEKYKKETGENLQSEDYLINQSEKDKIYLSNNKRKSAGGDEGLINDFTINVTKSEFEEKISSFISQMRMLCESTIDEANIKIQDINEIIMAGGSTRIPAVKQMVEDLVGKKPIFDNDNVDEIVALGAALYAAYKSDKKDLSEIQKQSIEQIKVLESTSKYYGTTALDMHKGKEELERVNIILIDKGTKIPCTKEDSVYTITEGQEKVLLDVTESGSAETDINFVQVVWEGELKLPKGRPKGQEIKIKFSYNENQIMNCSFIDVESGEELKVELSMTDTDNNGTSEIDKFLVE